jgi:hypothetical protein
VETTKEKDKSQHYLEDHLPDAVLACLQDS